MTSTFLETRTWCWSRRKGVLLSPNSQRSPCACCEGLKLPEPATILELRGISKSFPGVVALKDIDFSVIPGEVHVLLGENGAGKSTLIKIVAGTETRDTGEYLFAGQALRTPTPSTLRQIGVSVIHQELSLVRTMTVVDNIFLGRNLRSTT